MQQLINNRRLVRVLVLVVLLDVNVNDNFRCKDWNVAGSMSLCDDASIVFENVNAAFGFVFGKTPGFGQVELREIGSGR